jgi:hypothetical protein
LKNIGVDWSDEDEDDEGEDDKVDDDKVDGTNEVADPPGEDASTTTPAGDQVKEDEEKLEGEPGDYCLKNKQRIYRN